LAPSEDRPPMRSGKLHHDEHRREVEGEPDQAVRLPELRETLLKESASLFGFQREILRSELPGQGIRIHRVGRISPPAAPHSPAAGGLRAGGSGAGHDLAESIRKSAQKKTPALLVTSSGLVIR